MLAEIALGWAQECKFEHGNPASPTSEYKPMGQNIYALSAYPNKIDYAGITFSWFDEKQFYDYNDMTCVPGEMCGHYTQVHKPLYHFSKDHTLDHYTTHLYNAFIILKMLLIECFK